MKPGVILIICDGLGYRQEKKHNAVLAAKTPNLDYYEKNYPHLTLAASGEAVGLPEGQMGTSEANHLVIGAGRIIYQNLVKINRAIEEDKLKDNHEIISLCSQVKNNDSSLHLLGLLSDGGVHGHIEHLKALIKIAKSLEVKKIFLHLLADGRDVPPQSIRRYLDDLQFFLKQTGVGQIASIGGRYWGMDRDNNLDRIEKHFSVLVSGSKIKFDTPEDLIASNYQQGINDEFIEPASLKLANQSESLIKAHDGVIIANFRSDRAREITQRILAEKINDLKLLTMTRYGEDIDVPVIFPEEKISQTLSGVIAAQGLKQLKITETEKFTHLTFFFNAQKYEAEENEERIMIPSNRDVQTHDEKPEMKIAEISQAAIEAIQKNEYSFIAINLTNCDIVGHTGNFPAIIKAVEAVDRALGEIIAPALAHNYSVIITADHGNAEETFNTTENQPLTSHTLNPVPLFIVSKEQFKLKTTNGNLSVIAPTVLTLLGLEIPPEMTGQPLI